MGELGIGDADTVVAYDDAGGIMAARLVWMLRATGHDAALLDGGLAAWDGPLETEAVARRPRRSPRGPGRPTGSRRPTTPPTARTSCVDGRTRERYLGLDDPVDARWGHVPGARSLPVPREPRRGRPGPAGRGAAPRGSRPSGSTATAPVVSYCGSGVNACHTLLLAEHAGLGGGRLFPGSWSAWSADEARPLATGEE